MADLPEWKARLDGYRLGSLKSLFGVPKPVIGVVHLWPLPGSPGYCGYGVEAIVEHGLRDADALVQGGVDGLIVENMWDQPYHSGAADMQIESLAAHAVAARAVVQAVKIPVGINVVHNGGVNVLAIALAAGATFMRICLLTGAAIWDTGDIDEGSAPALLRRRKDLQAEPIKIFADVDKKHSVRLGPIDLETHIEWTEYYGADALIVSGRMTGNAPDVDKVRRARALAHRPILIGSGATAQNIRQLFQHADGVIVGSTLKYDGVPEKAVDVERVKQFMEAARAHD
ncbi:MAG: BtpA/SgcQ family protein [Chloroflexi bacterium]|nr:BtpA/SgcQ family protein [Chloroflexota bacterium]